MRCMGPFLAISIAIALRDCLTSTNKICPNAQVVFLDSMVCFICVPEFYFNQGSPRHIFCHAINTSINVTQELILTDKEDCFQKNGQTLEDYVRPYTQLIVQTSSVRCAGTMTRSSIFSEAGWISLAKCC